MMFSSPGYSGPREIDYLFIDGGSLRERIGNISKQFFASALFDVDFSKFGMHGYTKVFYYDAVPVQNNGETDDAYKVRTQSQRDFLDKTAGIDRVHVYEGDARKRRSGLQQKKVDVMIAVDMLTHAFRRNMHKATLLTGDGDFKPLIDALVQDGMFVTLWFPPGETSRELMNAADIRRPLRITEIHSLLTAESQQRFTIPVPINLHPSTPEKGVKLKEWNIGGVRHVINKTDYDYLFLRDVNANNRLNIRHENPALLRYFCKDALATDLPDFT